MYLLGHFQIPDKADIPKTNIFFLSYWLGVGACDMVGQEGCWQSVFSVPWLLFFFYCTATCRRPKMPKRVFSHSFPYPFWGQHCCPSRCPHLGSPLSPDVLPSFFFLSFCSSDWRRSMVLRLLIFCPASSNLLLNSSREFFISVLYFSAPEFLLGSFL